MLFILLKLYEYSIQYIYRPAFYPDGHTAEAGRGFATDAGLTLEDRRMTYDELMELSEEDRRNAFDTEINRIGDLEAERDSFKNENETLLASNKKLEEELKKTKELNFTLGRKVNTAGKKSAEELLNELFK